MPNVDITVHAKLADRALRRSEMELHARMHSLGRDAGSSFTDQFATGVERGSDRIMRAMERSASATEKVTQAEIRYRKALSSNDIEEVIAAQNRLAKVRKDLATQDERLAKSFGSLHGAGGEAKSLTADIANLGNQFQGLGRAASPAAMSALVPALGALVGVAAQASGAIGLLPGVLGTVVAGFGTAKIATLGFGEALDSMSDPAAFAEALKALSPNAQQAALSIRSMIPAFNELKNATQDALFDNVAPQLNQTVDALIPSITRLTTGVASGLNSALSGVMSQLASPQGMATLDQTINSIVTSFQNLAPAAAPFTQAVMQLVNVGASFMPQLSASVAQGAQAFANFINEASRTGQLQDFLQRGIDAMDELGPIVLDTLKTFLAMAPIGERVLPLIADTIHGISVAMGPVAEMTANFSPLFQTWEVAVTGVGAAFDVVTGAANAVIPVVNAITDAINTMLTPVRAAIGLANTLPGIDLPTIPEIGDIPQIGAQGSVPLGGGPNASRERRGYDPITPSAGIPGVPNGGFPTPSAPGDWWNGLIGAPTGGFGTPEQRRQREAAGGGGGGSSAASGPVAAYTGDPMELLGGFAVTGQLYGAAGGVLDAKHRTAQAQAELNGLESSNTATASEIQNARNELAKAEQSQYEAELRLNEAKQSTNEKYVNSMQGMATQLGDIGAQFDTDFGISKGLGGIAENVVKFVASLAAAPVLGPLSVTAQQGQVPYASQAMPQSYGAPGSYGAYPGDAALLANVPAGRYTQDERGDLTQGLADCSSAVEDLVNLLDGRPTGGASMSTHNADEWLRSRGFLPGTGGAGDFRVGFNEGHMQATLPGGTPFNWGSPAAAARRGIGGSGASDPAFTSHYYRPVSAAPRMPLGTPPSFPNVAGPALPSIATPQTFPGAPGPAATPLMPTAAPASYAPSAQGQGWQPSGGGAAGIGGVPAAALSGAAGGLDMMAPGAGAAAQIAMQLINRTIGYGAQVAGIGVNGLLETFGMSGSVLGDPSQSWFGRIASGFAGAGASIPNKAGQDQTPLKPQEEKQGAQDGLAGKPNNGPTVNIESYVQAPHRSNADAAKAMAFQSYAAAGGR